LLPAALLAYRLAAVNARMTRSSMLETLGSDFVRTAWAKGLASRVVWTRHALHNALIPVVTIAGLQLVGLLGGAIIAEQIFGMPGMGKILINAVTKRDFVAVQSIVLVMAVFAVLINLVIDVMYALLDPRLRQALQ
jgi:peptide/nickel transport system permease protein